jgi:serine protease Do
MHLTDLHVTSSRLRRFTVVTLTASMCGATGLVAQTQTPARAGAAAADLSRALEVTARAVNPAVVEIFTTGYAVRPGLVPHTADLVATQRGSGSGAIVDPDGYIVTNAHVVQGAQRVRVEIPIPATGQSILAPRSRSVTGQIVGIDEETDLAVIKVDERKLPTLAFGDSDDLQPGQVVVAFGSPRGLSNSVTLGVVSAVARQLTPESTMIYVQTDASINPGSSGGPLVDVSGRLVGINTLISSEAGGNEGLGFAAPSNIVRTVYEQIRKSGRVRRGDIGIRAQTITAVLAAGLGLDRNDGAILADVLPGSPAAKAGLRPGDLVLTLDGRPMENGRQLHINLYRRVVGETVQLGIQREGKPMRVAVPMGERPDRMSVLGDVDPRQNLVPRLGILGVTLDERLAAMVPALRVVSGVVVASTVAGALDSREGGLAAGDVIYSVNKTHVPTLKELRAVVDALKPGEPVVLQLERRGAMMYLSFTVE